jgi:hypothetical protein
MIGAIVSRAAGWFPSRLAWLAVPTAIAVMAFVLWAMGRTPICACGTIKLWHGTVQSAENSQQILDWYSFTHVVHGFLLYLLTWLLMRARPVATRLMVAVLIECIWEIVENSDFVISRYRAGTISLEYFGDSIINSIADVASMMLGFALAGWLPVWCIVAIAIAFELLLLYAIRDNLALNILMILHPLQSVKDWQTAPLLH